MFCDKRRWHQGLQLTHIDANCYPYFGHSCLYSGLYGIYQERTKVLCSQMCDRHTLNSIDSSSVDNIFQSPCCQRSNSWQREKLDCMWDHNYLCSCLDLVYIKHLHILRDTFTKVSIHLLSKFTRSRYRWRWRFQKKILQLIVLTKIILYW